jgi:hypothetical protein
MVGSHPKPVGRMEVDGMLQPGRAGALVVPTTVPAFTPPLTFALHPRPLVHAILGDRGQRIFSGERTPRIAWTRTPIIGEKG